VDASPDGFRWIDADDALGNVFSFLRYAEDGSVVACVANFSGAPHHGYRIGLPSGGHWREVLNSDFEGYGGSGVGNFGGIDAVEEPWHGQPFSATVSAPPLGTVWFLHEG
jgi:1,4-alpha-glucan branching enzyme